MPYLPPKSQGLVEPLQLHGGISSHQDYPILRKEANLIYFYWIIVELHCSAITGIQQSDSVIQIHVFSYSFPLWFIIWYEYSSLRRTVGPCFFLSILYMPLCYSQTPNPTLSSWQPSVYFLWPWWKTSVFQNCLGLYWIGQYFLHQRFLILFPRTTKNFRFSNSIKWSAKIWHERILFWGKVSVFHRFSKASMSQKSLRIFVIEDILGFPYDKSEYFYKEKWILLL